MSETQAEFNKDKAIKSREFIEGFWFMTLANYEQNKVVIKLLNDIKNKLSKK